MIFIKHLTIELLGCKDEDIFQAKIANELEKLAVLLRTKDDCPSRAELHSPESHIRWDIMLFPDDDVVEDLSSCTSSSKG